MPFENVGCNVPRSLHGGGFARLACLIRPDNSGHGEQPPLQTVFVVHQNALDGIGVARIGHAVQNNVGHTVAAHIAHIVAAGFLIDHNGKALPVFFVLAVEAAFPARLAVCLLERLWQIVCTGNIGGFVFNLREGFGLQAALVGRFVKRRRNCHGNGRRIFGFARHRNRKHQRGEQNQRRQKNNRRQVAPCPSFHILILHSHFRRRAQIAARRWKSSVLCLTGAPYTPDRS